MAEERVQRRLAAILAADVVGYSRLMRADEAGTLAALKELRADVIDPSIAQYHGRVVKLMGDGVLVEFASVVDAVECALKVQDGVAERAVSLPEAQRIKFRVGINLGDVIADGDDIYGDGVNVASRLEALAGPGEVYVSGTVQDHAAGKLAASFEDLGEQQAKNIVQPVRVYRARTSALHEKQRIHNLRTPGRRFPTSPRSPFCRFRTCRTIRSRSSLTDWLRTSLPAYRASTGSLSSPAIRASPTRAEVRRIERKAPESFDAWDYVMRARWHLSRRRKDENLEAKRLFEMALELDPNNTMALSGLTLTLSWIINFGQTGDLEGTRAVALDAARHAVNLDESDAEAQAAFALICLFSHQLDTGVAACRRALELNPNYAFAEGLLGHLLSWRGDYDEALVHAENAERLSPHDPAFSMSSIARPSAAFGAGDYEQAVRWAQKTIEIMPDLPAGWANLAQALGQLGRIDEGREAVAQLLRLVPHYNLRLLRAMLPSHLPEQMERRVEGLRKVGLPE